MLFRVGLPENTGQLVAAAAEHDIPVMLSANRLWNPKKNDFDYPGERYATRKWSKLALARLDVALDCGGYTAMKRYGGFRFPPSKYLELANCWGWAWYAAMDLCCEPELGGDALNRVRYTAFLLLHQLQILDDWRSRGASWLRDPVPVLQGWEPDHYRRSISLTDAALAGAGRPWPDMVGVGSVCRRGATDDIVEVVTAIDDELPAGVGFHLFGVKGVALRRFAGHPRLLSADSQSWDYTGSMKRRETGGYKIDDRVSRLIAFAHHHNNDNLRGPQTHLFYR